MSATNQRQSRRQRIEELLATQNLNGLLGDVSPYSERFWTQFSNQVRTSTKTLLRDLCDVLPGIPPAAVLANAWAVAVTNPAWLALLARSVDAIGDEELLRERERLVHLTLSVTDSDPLASAILELDPASSQSPPDLGSSRQLVPGLRLRYALAHRWAQGASTRELLQVAGDQPKASSYLRARELLRVMLVTSARRSSLPPLSMKEFKTAPPRLQAVAIARPELAALLLPPRIVQDEGLAARVAAGMDAAKSARVILDQLRDSLIAQDLPGMEVLLQALSSDVATIDQARVVFAGLGRLPARGERSVRRWEAPAPMEPVQDRAVATWVPLSPTATRRLRRFIPGFRLPQWWSLTAAKIAERIAKRRLATSNIPKAYLRGICRGWGSEEHSLLAASGRYEMIPEDSDVLQQLELADLCKAAAAHKGLLDSIAKRVHELPDARPVLAMLDGPNARLIQAQVAAALDRQLPGLPSTGWGRWVANCIGTPEWERGKGLASAGVDPLRVGLALLRAGRQPLDGIGFLESMCDMLTAGHRSDQDLEEAMVTFFRFDPEAFDGMLRAIPTAQLARVIENRDLPFKLLSTWQKVASGELRDAIWSARLRQAGSAAQLRATIMERPDQWASMPWNPAWIDLRGKTADKALALVLAARRHPDRLDSVRKVLSEAEYAGALRAVAHLLPPESRRERGYLELVAALGGSELKSLLSVMIQSDKGAAAGCKVDALYREYLLPKKSGGNRVISVPPRHLKRLQRKILERLLTPLGAHEAAFGFVPKRSIFGNASVHVGQRVVTNADVSNCFPSVKWSLVLGVLRRDLGNQFSPGAISILVDLCTAKGGLPIGAPTSPALLNRVLLRTDEILHAAARTRGCRYTRYADDLTFSGDRRAVQMLGIAKRTLSQIGLSLDEKKTTIYRPGRRQMVTGLVVNQKVGIPRRIRRRLRAAVHAMERGEQPHWHGKQTSEAAIGGRVSFLCQIHPEHGARLKARLLQVRQAKSESADG